MGSSWCVIESVWIKTVYVKILQIWENEIKPYVNLMINSVDLTKQVYLKHRLSCLHGKQNSTNMFTPFVV